MLTFFQVLLKPNAPRGMPETHALRAMKAAAPFDMLVRANTPIAAAGCVVAKGVPRSVCYLPHFSKPDAEGLVDEVNIEEKRPKCLGPDSTPLKHPKRAEQASLHDPSRGPPEKGHGAQMTVDVSQSSRTVTPATGCGKGNWRDSTAQYTTADLWNPYRDRTALASTSIQRPSSQEENGDMVLCGTRPHSSTLLTMHPHAAAIGSAMDVPQAAASQFTAYDSSLVQLSQPFQGRGFNDTNATPVDTGATKPHALTQEEHCDCSTGNGERKVQAIRALYGSTIRPCTVPAPAVVLPCAIPAAAEKEMRVWNHNPPTSSPIPATWSFVELDAADDSVNRGLNGQQHVSTHSLFPPFVQSFSAGAAASRKPDDTVLTNECMRSVHACNAPESHVCEDGAPPFMVDGQTHHSSSSSHWAVRSPQQNSAAVKQYAAVQAEEPQRRGKIPGHATGAEANAFKYSAFCPKQTQAFNLQKDVGRTREAGCKHASPGSRLTVTRIRPKKAPNMRKKQVTCAAGPTSSDWHGGAGMFVARTPEGACMTAAAAQSSRNTGHERGTVHAGQDALAVCVCRARASEQALRSIAASQVSPLLGTVDMHAYRLAFS
jgi:hypothetical protein